MTTSERNRMIAEFMEVAPESKIEWFRGDYPVYNYDWNLLMPVVDKIESLNLELNGVITSFDATIVYGDCRITDEDGIGIFETYQHSTDSKSKIEAVYNAVVEFILWYNQNKQS